LTYGHPRSGWRSRLGSSKCQQPLAWAEIHVRQRFLGGGLRFVLEASQIGLDDGVLALEVLVERALGDLSGCRELADAGEVDAAALEEDRRCLDDPGARAAPAW
jgi:hypothetical protein